MKQKPKMILFDYGGTLLCEPDWDMLRGECALFKHVVANPHHFTPEQLCSWEKDYFQSLQPVRDLGAEPTEIQMLRLKYGRNDLLEEQVEQVKMKSPDEQLLDRVMKVINKNISNSDLSVDSIADEVGISRVHLHRKMKELTGQTPHDFIRNIRLKQAAHLLSSQNMNITEVMYACGFNNAASFSTIFKKFYGMSPREYMNENKSK